MLRAIWRYLGRHHVALLALFVAMSGTAVAATYINGTRIKPRSLPENRLSAAAVSSLTASDLAKYCKAATSSPRSYADAPCRRVSATASSVSGIVLGTDGNPVISHSGHPTMLLWCNDRACLGDDESNEVINGTYCGSTSDIAIGSNGLPIVSQVNGGCTSDGTLQIVPCQDPACASPSESGTGFDVDGTGRWSSIEIGTDGNPVVSYYDGANGDLKVLHCDDRACDGTGDTLNVVDSSGDVGTHTSLAIGKNGNPVIAYYDVANKDLKVARCNDAACAGTNETISTVDSAGDVGEFASLAIGRDGNPVIAYYKRSTGDLRVARCNDPACAGGNERRSTVAASGDVGQHASLGIGLDGRPAVAFYDVRGQDLRIARCNDTACAGGNERLTTLDATDAGPARGAALAVGVDGIPIVAYVNAAGLGIKIARSPVP